MTKTGEDGLLAIASDEGLWILKMDKTNKIFTVSRKMKKSLILSICYIKENILVLGIPNILIVYDYHRSKVLGKIRTPTCDKQPKRLIPIGKFYISSRKSFNDIFL